MSRCTVVPTELVTGPAKLKHPQKALINESTTVLVHEITDTKNKWHFYQLCCQLCYTQDNVTKYKYLLKAVVYYYFYHSFVTFSDVIDG